MNTRYEFEKHKIKFIIDDDKDKYITFTFSNVTIQSQCFIQKCEVKNSKYNEWDSSFKIDDVVSPCESDNRNYTTTSNGCRTLINHLADGWGECLESVSLSLSSSVGISMTTQSMTL
ncbi:hypothetical protein RF11_14410 [Thelohanellus kitauei]|uniref:Uncharacterized protein n=1 Tax=Thelohanellus kitauei TaxID=669202 RepID=A0A0C2NCY7_THEKT|nr:hypothetical protein RF11_14410 [Thelohanellus kitauei]